MKKIISYLFIATIVFCTLAGVTAPKSVDAAASPTVDYAREAEYRIMADYVLSAPKIPTKKVKGPAGDIEAVKNLVIGDINASTYASAIPFMSSKSLEMFSQTPLFVSDMNKEVIHSYTLLKMDKPTFYKGLNYAKVKVQLKDERNKKSKDEYILIKENGVWKIDLVQMLSVLVKKSIKK